MSLTSRFSNGDGETVEGRKFRAELAQREMAPIVAATERLAKAQGQELIERKNLAIVELRAKMTREPVAFKTAPYNGEFTPAVIEAAIQNAFAEFEKLVTPENSKFIAQIMAVSYVNPVDTTLLKSWVDLHAWVVEQFTALENSYAPVVEAPVGVPADPYQSVKDEIAALEAKALTYVYGSKERNDLEKRAYVLSVKLETLADSEYQSVMQVIVEQSGKVLSGAHNLQFRQWLASPIQVRKYGVKPSAENIRFAFSEWSGSTEWLDSREREELQRRANVAGMTSDEVKNIVGFRNDYGTRVVRGIRQEGQ
jgi:hypothetical protein